MFDYLLEKDILARRPWPKAEDLQAEFAAIPRPEVPLPPDHLRPLSRHKDVWSYDHNRYSSPYDPQFWIDASVYPFGFIATMGPLDGCDFEGAADTRPHFWQMVHETKCRVVVMLTDLKEGERIKCSQYWPDHKEQYGNFLVEKTHERRKKNLHVRHFYVCDHPVLHLHLLGWKDNNAFPDLDDIDALVETVSKHQGSAPVVVHCSAGVGRTGSFISCYIIKKARQEGLFVNLPKLISLLREEVRVKTVEDFAQYKMILSYAEKYAIL